MYPAMKPTLITLILLLTSCGMPSEEVHKEVQACWGKDGGVYVVKSFYGSVMRVDCYE